MLRRLNHDINFQSGQITIHRSIWVTNYYNWFAAQVGQEYHAFFIPLQAQIPDQVFRLYRRAALLDGDLPHIPFPQVSPQALESKR